jgi:hypothetical protein
MAPRGLGRLTAHPVHTAAPRDIFACAASLVWFFLGGD